MADDVAITAGTGTTIATDEIAGRHFQRVKNTYGGDGTATDVDATHPMPVQIGDTTNQANVLAGDTGQNAQLIAGSRKEVTFSTTTVQAVAATDVSNYRWASVQITSQGGSATVTFQGSNDNATWVSVPMMASTTTSTIVFTSTTTALYHGPIAYRYFRLNVTGIASGTTAGVIQFFAQPAFMLLSSITADTEMPSAATLADGATNPSAPAVAAAGLVFNGGTWDRLRSFGSTGAPGVTPTPGTTGGWTPNSQTGLTNTKTQIKGAAGTLGGYVINNPNGSTIYVQVFDALSANVTVGTTTPTYVLAIPASGTVTLELTCGVNHATGITVAATTTATGGTAPSTALVAAFFYK